MHLVPEGEIIKYRVCPTNDIVKKKNVKDSYGNPRKYDKDDAVEPEKVFIEFFSISKVSAFVGPVAFCVVVLKSKDWFEVKKLRNL